MADLLTSAQLTAHGVRHGFALRTGGVSQPPFASLNLGRAVGDDPAAVAENQRRLGRAVGYDPQTLFEVSQVHGNAVREVHAGESSSALRREEADALVAGDTGTAIGVRVADCLALLLADPESGAVAAVHAGWRGAVAGVVESALRALLSVSGAAPERLLAAIFPHIRRCCFEVGAEVAEQLRQASPAGLDVVDARRPRPHADLQRLVQAQLLARGVVRERIEDIPGCTRCDAARFFSYRREGARSGRHLAAIVAR